jgi:hypothetical protein
MAVTGVRNVYANQMAKTVFFCPKACPAAILSLERAPIFRPARNCTKQQIKEMTAKPTIVQMETSLCTIDFTVTVIANANETHHK